MTTDIHAATQAIREALATFPKGWLTAFHEVREREPGVAEIGIFWEDTDSLAEVVTVDTGNYYDNAAAMPDARFIAACNPEAITAILAALEARDAEIAALSAQSRALRALVHHWKYYGGATNFEQMVEAAEKLLEPEARQIRGDGGKERKGC